MIQQLTRNALKGQQQLAQGSALGGEMGANQRPTGAKAFALTVRLSHAPCPPRALPWAMSGLALQAALNLKGQQRYYCQIKTLEN